MTETLAMLFDTTRCTGCEECVMACKRENQLSDDLPWSSQGNVSALSASRFCTILRRPGELFVRQQCRHCLEPACVSACLVGAMQQTPEGAVVYDGDRCIGCRYCMNACPYGIPRYDWQARVPFVRKCDLCHERIARGLNPACVEACPRDAAIFGRRPEVLDEAHRRIAAQPGRYLPEVFGEHEVGGTSVLYISDRPLDFLGWQADMGETPLPELTWSAMQKVPAAILGVGGLMTGVYWVIGRRMRLASEGNTAAGEDDTGSAATVAATNPGGGDD